MSRSYSLFLLTLLYLTLDSRAKILRNNALMNKMISHFQQDNNLSAEPRKKTHAHSTRVIDLTLIPEVEQLQAKKFSRVREPSNPELQTFPNSDSKQQEKITILMQNVLCKNFPAIPCKMIMADQALNRLIQRSIKQISFKKMKISKTTRSPRTESTVYPIINSEDLSNFLEVSHTGYYQNQNETKKEKKRKKDIREGVRNQWYSQEKAMMKKKKKAKKVTNHGISELYNGRKNFRKYYPHKVKYKDKNGIANVGTTHVDFLDNSANEMSMSVEMPQLTMPLMSPNSHKIAYKFEPSEAPVWRIDYMKHGIPSLNMFGYDDEKIMGKIMRTVPTVGLDETLADQTNLRKDINIHPADVYIKKNFVRKGFQLPEVAY